MDPLVLHSDFHCNLVRQAKTLHPLSIPLAAIDETLAQPSSYKRSKKRPFVHPLPQDDCYDLVDMISKSQIFYSNIEEDENFHHWRNRFHAIRLIDSPHCLADQSQP